MPAPTPRPESPNNVSSSLLTLLMGGFLPEIGRHLADDMHEHLLTLWRISVAALKLIG